MILDLAIDSRVFIWSELDEAVQELDILFNTENTELIGNAHFGVNWESFLWEMTPSPDQLKSYIYQKINEFCVVLRNMNVVVEVRCASGNYRSTYMVGIEVSQPGADNNNKIYRAYKLV